MTPTAQMLDHGAELCRTALAFVGVTEDGRPNRGHMIDAMHGIAGYDPGSQWCAVFVVAMRQMCADRLGLTVDNAKSASAVRCWIKSKPEHRVKPSEFFAGVQFCRTRDPADVDAVIKGEFKPGHTGLITGPAQVRSGHAGWWWPTIEGNTDSPTDPENDNGGGVYQKWLAVDDLRIVGGIAPAFSKRSP